MNLLEAPYPVLLLQEEGVVRNPLAQDFPLPQGKTLFWRGQLYRVARLEAEEGTYFLFLEVGELGFRAEAFQSFLRVLRGCRKSVVSLKGAS